MESTPATSPLAPRPRWRWTAVALLALPLAAVAAWEGGLSNVFVPRNFGVVEEGTIYRSGQVSRFLIEDFLEQHEIGLVVFMSGDKKDRPDVDAERVTAQRLGIERINCPLNGNGTGDIAQYANALEAVVRATREGKRSLIHCHTGAQRTGAAVAFYRLLVQNRPPDEVRRELLAYGHQPDDNPLLVAYVNDHIDTLARMLVERGVIDAVPSPVPRLEP